MNDFLLDDDGDLFFDDDGDLVITDSKAQEARIRILWFLDEWSWTDEDEEIGIPWFDILGSKNPNTEELKGYITDAIQAVEGVEMVESVDVDIDEETRTATISFVAIADDGDEIEEEVDVEWPSTE